MHAEVRDPAAAQALFDEARKLVRAGRYADACPKLQESNRLDPGIGTQFHLADCYERIGRSATAWALFLEVASQARASAQAEREQAALARAARLEGRLPRVEIRVPEAHRVPGLELRRDGVLVGEAQWGTPLPVDPGERELVASAPGRRTLSQRFQARLGEVITLEVPLLAAEQSAAEPASPVFRPLGDPAAPSGPESPPPRDSGPEESGSASSVLIPTLAGVGIVGIGVGTVFALMASSKNSDSRANCRADDPNRCTQSGVDQRNEALQSGNIATVGFLFGGAALGAAGVLWLLEDGDASSSAKRRAPVFALRAGGRLGPGHAGGYLSGAF